MRLHTLFGQLSEVAETGLQYYAYDLSKHRRTNLPFYSNE